MGSPTILSSSSFPQTPEKMSTRGREKKNQALTFKNENLVYFPDIVKNPRIFTGFEEYPTRFIRENTYVLQVGVLKIIHRISGKSNPVSIWRCSMKTIKIVKVRVLREGDTFFAGKWVTVEVPKKSVFIQIFSEHFYQRSQIPRAASLSRRSRATRVGRLSVMDFRRRNQTTLDDASSPLAFWFLEKNFKWDSIPSPDFPSSFSIAFLMRSSTTLMLRLISQSFNV